MRKHNILAVDQDVDNLKLIKNTFKKDFNVIISDNANQALELMKSTDIHVVITDQMLNGMTGLEFLKKTSQISPESIKIVLTGYSDTDLLLKTINNNRVYRYILKPWDPKELKMAIKNAMDTYTLTMDNKILVEKLKENYSKTVMMLATALEARDKYVQGHSERVAYSSKCIARRLNVSEKDIELLYSACLLHDIGKIGVPENVLNKVNSLDEEDLMYIKAHTSIGERILNPIPDFAEMIPLIRYHHERVDGKGYPDGLSGDEIPLLARIIAVTDTFDAITSDRPYRPGKSFDVAIKILQEAKGTQLDAKIVDVFVEILTEKKISSVWEIELT